MGTSETAVSAYYEEEEEEEDELYEFEPLPALLEDEENVSLADILSLRDSCLSESEVWAVCLECVLALQSIAHSPLFHMLCITPDTLAFNAHGNVSFMEQLSDDPEGSFMPPEFDRTGNTFEGHVYSLGSTLVAALDFVIEPELEPDLGLEIRRLLNQMQQKNPSDRPCIQDIVTLAVGQLQRDSSMGICRKLSAIGRRVLSIESLGALHDELEDSWAAREQEQSIKARWAAVNGPRDPADAASTRGNHAIGFAAGKPAARSREAWPCTDVAVGGEEASPRSEADLFELCVNSRSQDSSPVRRALGRSARARGALNRSSSVPDSNNPPAPPPILHVNMHTPLADLTEIGAEEGSVDGIAWNAGLHNGIRDPDPDMGVWPARGEHTGARQFSPSSLDGNTNLGHCELGPEVAAQEGLTNHKVDEALQSNGMARISNHMTKSMLCLNEETQDEWISLRELLSQYCRPLSVNELWALCYTCLSTLQSYIDFPAYLCLDSVYIGCEGEVLFLKPKNTGSCDPFYLAPEYQEHGIVTEKACIYGVAAILWATAKFSLSPNQKLAMPRKLKRLLLEMAKRIPIERPSIIVAKKCCRDYLNHQGVAAEVVWAKLIQRAHQAHHKDCDTDNSLDNMKMANQSPQMKIGFVPCTEERGLSPVPGPVPHRYHVSTDSHLPKAFTSPATHFTPIVLTRDGATEGEGGARDPGAEGFWCDNESPGGDQPEVLQNTDHSLMKGGLSREGACQRTITQETGASRERSSTSSSGDTLVNSVSPPSPTHVHTSQDVSSLPLHLGPASSCPSSNQHAGSFGSFLLRQDPRTGLLTLFPVQISVPAPIPGLDLGLPSPFSSSLPGQEWQAAGQNGSVPTASAPAKPGGHVNKTPGPAQTPPDPSPQNPAHLPAGSRGKHGPAQGVVLRVEGGTPSVSSQASLAQYPMMHPCLQAVIVLVRDEFAFQGYLENGVEDRAMGEYIFSLRNLHYETFCSAVSEKYHDLYWDEKLLDALYHVINKAEAPLSPRDSSCIQSSNARPPSNGQRRAASSAGRERGERGGVGAASRDRLEPGLPEPKGAREAPPGPSDSGVEDVPPGPHTQVCRSVEEPPTPEPRITCLSEETQLHGLPDASPDPIPKEVTDGGCLEMDSQECSAGGAVEACYAESSWHAGVGQGCPRRGQLSQLSLDYSEDMEDTDSLTSIGGLQDEGRPQGAGGCGCAQGWALSFYGKEYFKEDVLRYANKLGQGSKSLCLEAKMQELHQQLMIETRNLKKTRNFYNKLLHKERKNKGSDAKIMILKIKVQLEEMKTKVDFLDSVRKYLEVLCVDQWGLDVPLLRSLAVSGTAPLELRPSEDPSILTFQSGTGRGRGSPGGTTSLQAGTPLGLMSYLYARNAPLEGYIQQFLYTYRYFCTPEDFLQFLKDRFISVAGDSQAPSAERSKVQHRTLDLLQAWLEDSCQVDFRSKSSLYQSLEEFLISQVIPVEGRGEALLTLLQSPHRKRRSHMVSGCCGSPISIQEADDTQTMHSVCRKASIEDSGRKSFQWRISRVVEPQSAQPKEKPFSIAAALPRPCYSSLLDQLSGSSLRTEDRYPFYQSEHRAQHAADQLTLLQQEIFQGCHPVHFLNSRAQGVREKTVSRSLSPDLPPTEGSSLFASDTVLQDRYLPQLLKQADSVATWVSAEIVICDSLKAQAGLITKFLLMAKCCYESRNFATAIQILGGLENVIIKQLPAWRHLSAKAWQILEELRTVQVFLKSDNLCLMEGERFKRKPTIPAAHILAMHIQQLEIGAFTLANGAYKWPKLRNIAKVVSQVHAFQENVFTHAPDLELQAYLRHRIALQSSSDIALLAAENDGNFHQISAERHSKKIQDTLRRVKATFQ